ncbi:hypothetical protein FSARC_10562 [Fusarium sarcochroum]|uniref:Cullin N-terminal domain-containing protein n=1 Tax=Fusarium sarcochroum TaxID=1208366 RepID=A0A8H4TLI0_9HYPO|nr:hypothetical protein FSARC_10562 [Fusarium sarcochroum]
MANAQNTPKLPDENDNQGLQAYLRNGISAIHNNPELQLQPSVYMDLYTAVWRLTYREDSNKGVRSKVLYADVIYQDLANLLAEHLQLVVKRLQSQDDSLLLEAYLTEWGRYATAANRIDRLLNLINRHWVQRCIDEEKPGVYYIRTLHSVQWRYYIWDKISVAVIDSAQLVMEKDDGKAAKAHDMLESFASLRIDDSASDSDTQTRIRKSLEAPFMLEIEAHERRLEDIIAARRSQGHYVDGQ